MNVIRTTATGTLESSYGGMQTQRTKLSSFYLPPRAFSTPLSVGYRGRNQVRVPGGTRVSRIHLERSHILSRKSGLTDVSQAHYVSD
jgi:hypothetical protein